MYQDSLSVVSKVLHQCKTLIIGDTGLGGGVLRGYMGNYTFHSIFSVDPKIFIKYKVY